MAKNPNINAFGGFGATINLTPNSSDVGVTSGGSFNLRASSFGLNAKQETNIPELIDGAIDGTAYGLGGIMVEGDIAFPMTHEGAAYGLTGNKANCSPFKKSLAQTMWTMAAARSSLGKLKYFADIEVAYPDNFVCTYATAYVNKLGLKVTQGGNLEMSSTWLALQKNSDATTPSTTPNYLSPARIVNWSDMQLLIYSDSSASQGVQRIATAVTGEGIREFTVNLDNQIDRAFTFNGSAFAEDVYAKKRKINGTLKMLGRSYYLNNMGINMVTAGQGNQAFITSDEHIAFGYAIGGGNIYWSTILHGVVFKPEELSLTPNEVFESSVAFDAMGDCGFNFEALELGTNPGTPTLTVDSGTTYGGPSYTYPTGSSSAFQGWSNNTGT
jgi:hypothetical protein